MTELPINEGQSILEREVRDYVAKNLTVALGESFELARIEHPVSFGRIDILAWDSSQPRCHRIEAWYRDARGHRSTPKLHGALTDEYPDSFVRGILIAAALDAGAEAALKMSRDIRFLAYTLAFTFTLGHHSPSTYDQWKKKDAASDPPVTEERQKRSSIWLPPSFGRRDELDASWELA